MSTTVTEEKANVAFLSKIASPLASSKLEKRLLKLVKKSAKVKCLKRGVKEVVKSIRKKNTGIAILAGDISPIDVLSHVPVLCEDSGIPYIYVPSRSDLGIAGSTRRPTCCVLVSKPEDEELVKLYEKCIAEIKESS